MYVNAGLISSMPEVLTALNDLLPTAGYTINHVSIDEPTNSSMSVTFPTVVGNPSMAVRLKTAVTTSGSIQQMGCFGGDAYVDPDTITNENTVGVGWAQSSTSRPATNGIVWPVTLHIWAMDDHFGYALVNQSNGHCYMASFGLTYTTNLFSEERLRYVFSSAGVSASNASYQIAMCDAPRTSIYTQTAGTVQIRGAVQDGIADNTWQGIWSGGSGSGDGSNGFRHIKYNQAGGNFGLIGQYWNVFPKLSFAPSLTSILLPYSPMHRHNGPYRMSVVCPAIFITKMEFVGAGDELIYDGKRIRVFPHGNDSSDAMGIGFWVDDE